MRTCQTMTYRMTMSDTNITQGQLHTLEQVLDKLFAHLNIDIEFTRHFLERANDSRNKQPISLMELADMFGKTYRKYGQRIHDMNEAAEAVLTDLKTMINIPFVVRHNRRTGMLEMISKTVMRKKGFLSHDPKLVLNSLGLTILGQLVVLADTQKLKYKDWMGDGKTIDIMTNFDLSALNKFALKNEDELGVFVTDDGKMIAFNESHITSHKEVIEAMKIKAPKTLRFRMEVKDGKFVVTPSDDSLAKHMLANKQIQKLFHDKNRPLLVQPAAKDKHDTVQIVMPDGKKFAIDNVDKIDRHGNISDIPVKPDVTVKPDTVKNPNPHGRKKMVKRQYAEQWMKKRDVQGRVGRVVTAMTNFVYHDFEVIPLKKVGHISKGGINEWKKNSGDIELAGKAAAFYAKRYREDVFVIPGNSYGHRLWNPVMSSQGMNGTRGIRTLTVVTPKEGQLIILVKPNGDVWHGHYHFGTSE